MQATIEDGDLIVRIPLKRDPYPSSSGKSMIVASSDGPANTEATIDGKPVGVRLTAWVPRRDRKGQDEE